MKALALNKNLFQEYEPGQETEQQIDVQNTLK